MGAAQCCENAVDLTVEKGDYRAQNIHHPPPHYAVKIENLAELPFDLNQLRNMHHVEQLRVPDWYNEKQTYHSDHTFLLLGFGVYYHGEWFRGVPHGYAEIFTKQGEYFRGYLRQGVVQCPQGLLVSSPHNYYIGAVSKNQKNGFGLYVHGLYSYEGSWLGNLPHGSNCTQRFPNGDVFVGSFRQGGKEEGVYTWKQGPFERYQGYFKDNQMYGRGQLLLKNNCSWTGLFDCSKNIFQIKNATCKFEDKIFEGNIQDLRPMEGSPIEIYHSQLFGKTTTFKGKLFQGKLLVHYDRAMKGRLREILSKIELGYQDCDRHSQAITIISKALPEFTLEFWTQGERQQGVAIVPICGRFIKVSKRE